MAQSSPLSPGTKVLIGVGLFSVATLGTCAACGLVGLAGLATDEAEREKAEASSSASAVASAASAPVPSASAEPEEKVLGVGLAHLLAEYKDNEVRADMKFKDRVVAVAGAVREVSSGLDGNAHVTIGNHNLKGLEAELELFQVQCVTSEDQRERVAAVNVGQVALAKGTVLGLVMGSVVLSPCKLYTLDKQDGGAASPPQN